MLKDNDVAMLTLKEDAFCLLLKTDTIQYDYYSETLTKIGH